MVKDRKNKRGGSKSPNVSREENEKQIQSPTVKEAETLVASPFRRSTRVCRTPVEEIQSSENDMETSPRKSAEINQQNGGGLKRNPTIENIDKLQKISPELKEVFVKLKRMTPEVGKQIDDMINLTINIMDTPQKPLILSSESATRKNYEEEGTVWLESELAPSTPFSRIETNERKERFSNTRNIPLPQ